MFKTNTFFNLRNKLSLLLIVGLVALGFTRPISALAAGPAPVDLLSAGDFVILAETGITNTGSHTTALTGNIGNSPGTSAQMNNVWCSEITGTIYGVDAAYTGSGTTTCFAGNPPLANKTLVDTAVGDMVTAYNNAAGVVSPAPEVNLGAGNISGLTITPGLYKWDSSVIINSDVTLSGGANDVWIFQIAGDLNIASGGSVPSGIKVLLSGGAKASNVFWQVGGGTGATLGTYSTFEGTILSAKQIILETGAVLNGRALAQTQVTLDANVVTAPCPSISLLPAAPLPQGTVGDGYNETITAGGGTGPYTFAITSGGLPDGLLFDTETGIISGMPTAAGSFTFTVTATDANLCSGLRAYTIVINAAVCPTITLSPPPPLPQGTEGVAYDQTITAGGGTGPYTFSITAGALPTGLLFDTETGLISGTPTAAGSFTFTVTATDTASGCKGLETYTMVINAANCSTISLLPTPPLPQGTVGTAYSRTITAVGGTEPYTFSITAGALPDGLLFDTETGLISGTPTAAGSFTFTVTAMGATRDCKGLQAYTLVINAANCPTISVLPALPLPGGNLGSAYSRTITADGGTGPYTFSITAGALPDGLLFDMGTGLISGTPTAIGTYNFTVTATDANNCRGLEAYSIDINGVIPTLSTWGMIIFMVLMAFGSIYYLGKRRIDI